MTDTAPADPTTPDTLDLLRSLWALTPENLRGKLPKPYKKDAEKGQCKDCGGFHGLPAMHLDYLGHADTCRLIAEKDILWQWEPKGGWEPNGEPVFVRNNGGYPIALWIDLTICGVTRPGVGTVTTGKPDPEKELIGDAIRNAAMRFGVGADMWSKAHHAEVAAEDGSERTYSRAAEPVDPEQWFKANGWEGEADHDLRRAEARGDAAALRPESRSKIKEWMKSASLAFETAWTRAEVDELISRTKALEAERAPAPHQDDEKASSLPEPTDAAAPTPVPAPEPEKPKPAKRGGPLVKCAWCGKEIKDEAALPVMFEGEARFMMSKCKVEWEQEQADTAAGQRPLL